MSRPQRSTRRIRAKRARAQARFERVREVRRKLGLEATPVECDPNEFASTEELEELQESCIKYVVAKLFGIHEKPKYTLDQWYQYAIGTSTPPPLDDDEVDEQ